MKNLLLILLGGLLLLSCGTSPEPKTIYIVRHAEKMLVEDSDPELSQVGVLRATKLGQIMADKEIKHVFSTDYKRTKYTAWPSADQAAVQIEIYDPKDQEAFAEKLKSLEGNILVVGHSNTVPALANFFSESGDQFPNLTDDEYQFIYLVTIAQSGIKVEQKTYKDF